MRFPTGIAEQKRGGGRVAGEGLQIDDSCRLRQRDRLRACRPCHTETVFNERDVYVVDQANRVVGMVAVSDDAYVTALYVSARHRGMCLGKALLDRAKNIFPDNLNLWTFVSNFDARRFYEREGFKEVRRTNGENEECLPDILFCWKPN